MTAIHNSLTTQHNALKVIPNGLTTRHDELNHCLLQALCKLSELDSSEISKEYKDPTDAYVVGDVVRGN